MDTEDKGRIWMIRILHMLGVGQRQVWQRGCI